MTDEQKRQSGVPQNQTWRPFIIIVSFVAAILFIVFTSCHYYGRSKKMEAVEEYLKGTAKWAYKIDTVKFNGNAVEAEVQLQNGLGAWSRYYLYSFLKKDGMFNYHISSYETGFDKDKTKALLEWVDLSK